MARTNKTPGPPGPRVGDRVARTGRVASGAPADDAVVSLAEPLLDCEGAAALLNVRVSWVRDAARLGHMPCLRVGRHLRFTRVMLEDWLAERFTSPPSRSRPCARAVGSSGVPTPVFRRRTEAALLASLTARPTNTEMDDG